MIDLDDLIAEAGVFADAPTPSKSEVVPAAEFQSLVKRLRDALEAATRERAAVPDAATEERAERDAAVAAIERLNARHRKIEASAVTGDCAIEECEHEDECPTEVFEVCAACWNLCESADPYFGERGIAPVLWPCEIATALDGAPEPGEKP